MRLDEIRIEDLEVFANHGVFHEENVLGQKFLVTAVLCTDTREAGKTDELAASVHYGEVSAFYRKVSERTYFQTSGESGRMPCGGTSAVTPPSAENTA